jgi:mannosylglycerate hydrolase
MSKPSSKAILVSHTHWDRAWYLTFGQFQFRLVHMIDRILDLLERDSEFNCFVLDGQVILIQDYLEIRPENESRLSTLIADGRLVIGPWYILPDLFLECGEAIIRNLQLGHRISGKYGRELSVGYVPDPFGHIAQLPQILNGFSIDTFIFMRGMPKELADKKTLYFNWFSPDGSSVLAYYTKEGYFNAANLGHDHILGRYDLVKPDLNLAKEAAQKALSKLSENQPSHLFLFNNGVDHMPEQKEIPEILSYLNQEIPDTEFVQGDFSDFMDELKKVPAQDSYTGDLLDNPDHPILSSVYSARSYLKQLNHKTQSRLIRYTEPLGWIFSTFFSEKWAQDSPFVEKAWELLLKNHPHDDICGCSIDPVHEQNERNFQDALELCESVLLRGIEELYGCGIDQIRAEDLDKSKLGDLDEDEPNPRFKDVFAFNPHPYPLKQKVSTYIVFPNHQGEEDEVQPVRELMLFSPEKKQIPIQVVHTTAPYLRAEFIQHTWGRRYDIEFEAELPPLSYGFFRVFESSKLSEETRPDRSQEEPLLELNNGTYRVYLSNQKLCLDSLKTGKTIQDLIQFEFVQDNGDTYSFSRANKEVWRASLDHAEISNYGNERFNLIYTLVIPEGLEQEKTVEIPIHVSLHFKRDGEIALDIAYTNTACDGRLQLHLQTGCTSHTCYSDGHFLLNEHEIKEEQSAKDHAERYQSYPGELVYTTHFQGDGSFIKDDEGSFWFSSNGAHEIELLNTSSQSVMAVTLHRSVGYLSVSNGSIRRPQAGPHVPTPGAQCLRSMKWECSIGVQKGDTGEILRMIKASSHPIYAVPVPTLQRSPESGSIPSMKSFLNIKNSNVELSALYRSADTGDVVVRLVNLGSDTEKVELELGQTFSQWCRSDLLDKWNDDTAISLNGDQIEMDIPAHGIETLILRSTSSI